MLVPILWLTFAVILLIIEGLTFNLFTIWFAVGAIGAMIVGLCFGDQSSTVNSLVIQGIVFIVLSVLMILTIRDYAVKKLSKTRIKTNVNALAGRKAVVIKTIQPYSFGQVKIDGTFWTAKPANDETIEEGSVVEIIEVSGVKLIVKKV